MIPGCDGAGKFEYLKLRTGEAAAYRGNFVPIRIPQIGGVKIGIVLRSKAGGAF